MTKNEFLNALRHNLTNRLSSQEIEEILRDQEEYIRDAVAAGRSESVVVHGLGDPKVFAKGMVAESRVAQATSSTSLKSQLHSTLSALGALLVLAPFNLIFVFGPFVAAAALVFTGWALAGATTFASVAFFGATLFENLPFELVTWEKASLAFFSLGSAGVGCLASIAMYYVTKGFVQGTLAYIRWNLNFITKN